MKKKILAYIGIIAAFLIISYGFVPQVLGGKIVNQSDITGYIGMAHEANAWNAAHPNDPTAWTDSMFGGMPTTMLTGNEGGDATQPLYDAFFVGKRPASYLFISLLGAFLLMLALGIHPFLAAGGAIAITFCSYNLQIIQVGHNAKMVAIAWAPWVLAAVIYTYRKALSCAEICFKSLKDWAGMLLGPVLTAIALSFQIKANHVQITYYLGIIIVSYFLVMAVWLLAKKRELLKKFLLTSALLVVFAGIGIATNANRLLPTMEYTQETMRGGSELTKDGGEKTKGLDFEYATQWSYGTDELANIMIPNYKGGASYGGVNPDKSATIGFLKDYHKQMGQPMSKSDMQYYANVLPMYWGPQPFTAGPMYIGAITVFLFILGLCLPKGKEKWWLLIPSVIGILLALGGTYGRADFFSKLFRGFNVFWFETMPFYNKFRTVSMALVILQFTMPMLGFLALDRVLKGNYNKWQLGISTCIALFFTALFFLVCYIAPEVAGDFTKAGDPSGLEDFLASDRRSLLQGDALTALVLIIATAALIFWAKLSNNTRKTASRSIIAGAGICLMVALNLFVVGKRYLNSDHFVSEKQFKSHFNQRPVDKYILEDKTVSYRVADLTVNIFNDATPSYWHKSVGGYSPVKLQRYQDLIDNYLGTEIYQLQWMLKNNASNEDIQEFLGSKPMKALAVLNCKYLITDGSRLPVENPWALGNAWFADSLIVASTPDEEMALFGGADLSKYAILAPGAPAEVLASALEPSEDAAQDSIELSSYAPNHLIYSYKTSTERLAVLSEIWCKYGWKAWLEDTAGNKIADVSLLKADWTLRAALLPAGEGRLVMHFEPKSYATGRTVSAASSWLLILLVLAAGGYNLLILRRTRKQ